MIGSKWSVIFDPEMIGMDTTAQHTKREVVYQKWVIKRSVQEETLQLLGGCERAFRRCIYRYQHEGFGGVLVSYQKAPVGRVVRSELPGWIRSLTRDATLSRLSTVIRLKSNLS